MEKGAEIMGIIDFHTHIYPEVIAEKAVHSVSSFYSIEVDCPATPEDLLAAGKKTGCSDLGTGDGGVDGRAGESNRANDRYRGSGQGKGCC